MLKRNPDNVSGITNAVDINGGTVDDNVYGQYIEIDVEDASNVASIIAGLYILIDDADTTGHTTYNIACVDTGGTDYLFRGYSSGQNTILFTPGGDGYWDGAADNGAASDYAEYFESTDGSVIPIGNTVTLENGKVKQASDGDNILGVVRPHDGVIVANSQWAKWKNKYMTTYYGENIWEEYTTTGWTEEITFEEYIARGKDETGGVFCGQVKDEKVEGSKAIPAKDAVTQQKTVDEEVEEEVTTTEVVLEDGKYVQKTTTETVTKTVKVPQYDEVDLYDKDGEVIGKHQIPIMETVEEAVAGVDAVPDTYVREHKYHSDKLPEGVTAPDDAVVITARKKRKQLNSDYDPSKAESYKPREERDEWCIVGLLGQIPITKGQPLADNWSKMSDVSDTVEMYFVK